MKRLYFSLFSLMIILTTSFSCFGMKKEKGCCAALKHAARVANERVRDLACSENGKDVELALLPASEKADSGSSKRCLTKRKKRAWAGVAIVALLAGSVGGGYGAGYLESGTDSSASAVTPSIPLSPPPSPLVPLTPATPSIPLHPPQKKLFFGMWHRGDGCEVLGLANVSNDEKTVSAKVRAEPWTPNVWCSVFTLMNFEKVSCVIVDDYKTDAACKVLSPPNVNDTALFEAMMIGDNLDSTECQVKCRDDSLYHSNHHYATSVCVSQKACDTYILSRPNNACNVNQTELDGWKCSFKSQQKHQNQKQNATRSTRERRPKQPKHRGR